MTLIGLVFDILWLIIVGSVWSKDLKGDNIWNSLSGVHGFAEFMTVINLILKVSFNYKNIN